MEDLHKVFGVDNARILHILHVFSHWLKSKSDYTDSLYYSEIYALLVTFCEQRDDITKREMIYLTHIISVSLDDKS